jgi:hypothetical protein
MAAKGARMKNELAAPPRWAEAILRSLLRPADRESTSGDLLEEYRAVRYPSNGRLRANAWYIKHVASVLLHFMWPILPAAALVGLLQVMHNSPWNYSPVPAPGLSIFHGALYFGSSFLASRRTGLIRTGIIAGAVASFVAFAITMTGLVVAHPQLFTAPFSNPFIFVILVVLILMALSVGIVAGACGGMIGRWLKPFLDRKFALHRYRH